VKLKLPASLLVLLLVSLSFFGACKRNETANAPLKVAITAYPPDALTYVAKEKGFFDALGVSVELVFFKEMHEARRMFELGKVDGIFDVIQDEIKRQAQGFGSKIVFIQDVSQVSDAIVARKGIDRLKDLKGKTIGIDAPYSSSHVFVREAVSGAGLADWDVFIKRIDATEAVNALDRGDVDAAHTWEPTLSQALKKGYVRLANAQDHPYLITDIISFSAASRSSREKDIEAFIRGYLAAQNYLSSNRESALEIIARNIGVALADLDAAFKGVQLGDVELNRRLILKGDAAMYGAIVKMFDFYDKRGLMSKDIRPVELFDPVFIREIK